MEDVLTPLHVVEIGEDLFHGWGILRLMGSGCFFLMMSLSQPVMRILVFSVGTWGLVEMPVEFIPSSSLLSDLNWGG